MDRKTFSIAVLSLTAIVLTLVCFMPVKQANAQFAVKDLSRFQMITVPSQRSGSIVYLIDPQGKILVMSFDMQQKVMKPVAGSDLDRVFNVK